MFEILDKLVEILINYHLILAEKRTRGVDKHAYVHWS